MSENGNKSRREELDDFWDLSSLVPKRSFNQPSTKNTDTSAVELSDIRPATAPKATTENDTVIKRYINPLHYEQKKIRRESFESSEVYYPENSLLHRVTLKKRKSEYQLYGEFLEDAKRYKDAQASECEFEPYYSYVPQYNQLTSAQLDYYLWWRECFRNGRPIKIDYSYVLLYIYELINLGEHQDLRYAQEQLTSLWNCYHKEYSALASKLATWICDFSLIHRLPAPSGASHRIGKHAPALKEFYLHMPQGDYDGCARSLIKYGTEYDYRTSKFAKEENIAVFDTHILGAMHTAVKFYSKGGVLLSELASEDSKLVRNSFEGALTTSDQRYEIEVKYCSFSRSNELRYIMGDIVKYSENKIRAYLGIKSRLSVYSVSGELQKAIDSYFDAALLSKPRVSAKKDEKHDYDALYDLPKSTLSLEKAKQIEKNSWEVTRDLISAFEEEESTTDEITPKILVGTPPADTPSEEEQADLSLISALGEYAELARAIKRKDLSACVEFVSAHGKLLESAVDEINEIAVEIIGDTLIEEIDGGFEIIACYSDMI